MRRLAAAVAACAVALIALVAVGRYEADRHADEENAGIARVRSLVGALDNPTLAAYRRTGYFDCLLYRRGSNPFALELCFETDGRVVEAIDRRASEPQIWSLREDRGRATVRVDPSTVAALLRQMEAP